MDGNTLLDFEQFKALDINEQYMNYVREYKCKCDAKVSLIAAERYGLSRERRAKRGLVLPKGFNDLERLDQGMMIVMLRKVEKAIESNSPDTNNLIYNLKEECKTKRMSFEDLKSFTSDSLVQSTLNQLSRSDLCKFFALMCDLLAEVTPVTRKTLKTMPLVSNEVSTPLDNIKVINHEVGRVTETRYHKHSASFASLGELHTLQHLDVMSDELGVYNLGVAGTMFDCMYKDDEGKVMACSSISSWNDAVSFCSLMPRMSGKDEVHTIVRRLAGLPTKAVLCKDASIPHVRYHVGRAITYILSEYAISHCSIGYDEIGAPTFTFHAQHDVKRIPVTCCARPKPVKSQKRANNNVGKRHFNTWRWLGDSIGSVETPVDLGHHNRQDRGRRRRNDNQRQCSITRSTMVCATQTAQYQTAQYETIRTVMAPPVSACATPLPNIDDVHEYPALSNVACNSAINIQSFSNMT